jgi:membrane protein implicated in regulation of membrane protease activity
MDLMEFNIVWIWAAVATVLLIGEMMTATFGLLFFGLAAVVTALIVLVAPNIGVEAQIIIFAVLGLVGAFFGRKWIKQKLAARAAPAFQVDSNSEFVVDRDIEPEAEGAVLYQGVPWTAVNDSREPIRKGDRVIVVRTVGIKLIIQRVQRG